MVNLLIGAEVSRKTADSRQSGAALAETLFERKDAAIITGDALVKPLDGMKQNLMPRQIGVLRNRLAGGRLTFTRMQGVDCIVGRRDNSRNLLSVIQMNRSATWSEHNTRLGIVLRTPDAEYRKLLDGRRLDKCDDLRVVVRIDILLDRLLNGGDEISHEVKRQKPLWLL